MHLFITGVAGTIYEFVIPLTKYHSGQPLGEVEAQILNRLVAENVAKNRTPWLRRRESSNGEQLLTIEEIDAIAKELIGYVTAYSLSPISPTRMGDIEREALEVAQHRECVCLGRDLLCPDCRGEGRKRYLAKRGIAARALEEL